MLQHYAARKALPHRRQELYGAQSAWAALRAAGAREAQPQDFLLDPPTQEELAEEADAIEEMRQALGFPARRK